MQFLVLLGSVHHFDDWDAADEALRTRYVADYRAFADAVRQRGRIVVGDAHTGPEAARCLRPGQPRMVTEGPFAETVEQIGGFYVVDLPDLDTAVEVAGPLPKEYVVEVRPTLGIEV